MRLSSPAHPFIPPAGRVALGELAADRGSCSGEPTVPAARRSR